MYLLHLFHPSSEFVLEVVRDVDVVDVFVVDDDVERDARFRSSPTNFFQLLPCSCSCSYSCCVRGGNE